MPAPVTRTWVAGEVVLDSHFNTNIRDPLNYLLAADASTAWPVWTPTLTNLTLGNGTVTARGRLVGKTLDYRFKFKLGNSSAVGTSPRFTLPFTPHASYVTNGEDLLGRGNLLEGGIADHPAVVRLVSGTTVEIFKETDTAHTTVTATVPFTWGDTDVLSVAGTIELA